MTGDLPVTPTVLAVVVGICVAIVIGSWLIERRQDRNARILKERTAQAARTKGTVPPVDDRPILVGDFGRMAPLPEALYEEILAVDPTPTLGQERIYADHTPVPYGTVMVGSGCLRARRDYATDHICAECVAAFGRVGS